MTNKFYFNSNKNLWDERKSPRQILTNVEWEIGLEAGDIIREISKVLNKSLSKKLLTDAICVIFTK